MDIKLNPNGWHRRLQKFVFSDPPMYHNFCPYFWFTNFCILVTFIVPIVPLIKCILLICGAISVVFEKAGDYFEEVICKPRFEKMALNMDPDLILRSWTLYDEEHMHYEEWDNERWKLNSLFRNEVYSTDYKLNSKKRMEMRKKFEVWKEKTPNWKEILDAHKAKKLAAMEQLKADRAAMKEKMWRQQQEDARREELAKIRRQKMFTWIATNTKWLIYPILTMGAAFILYWVGVGAINIWEYTVDHFYYDKFVMVVKVLGYVLMYAAPIVVVFYFLIKVLSRVACSSTFCFCDTWIAKYFLKYLVDYLLLPIWKAVKWLGIGIGRSISRAWDFIMIFKSNYCPGITWEEDKK